MRPLIAAIWLLPMVTSFSFGPCNFTPIAGSRICSKGVSRHRLASGILAMQIDDVGSNKYDAERILARKNPRRGILSKTLAAAAAVSAASTNADPAAAITTEPTRIELQVDTEYLVRVLEYFDGDMNKVLGVLIRSPMTDVQIDPPNPKGIDGGGGAEATDAILRALYSYETPGNYITQANWVKVEEKGKSILELLVKKRYKFSFGNNEEGGLKKTTVSLSNLEVGVTAGVIAYPLAFAYYNFESYKEEQEKMEKKKNMQLKKKKAAAKKKEKVAKPKDVSPVAKETAEQSKGQTEAKSVPKAPAVTKIGATEKQQQPSVAATATPEPQVASVANGQSNSNVDVAPSVVFQQNANPPAPEPPKEIKSFMYAERPKAKKSSDGMDAYSAQMAAMMAIGEPDFSPAPLNTDETISGSPELLSSTGSYLDSLSP